METGNRALIIVDVQPTFCEGGALGVEGGNAVAERIANFVTEYGDEYDLIVTTQDWHVSPGEHFSDEPDFIDTWPPHGVAGTPEAELHEAIASLPIDASVKKGAYEAAYSGFEGVDHDAEPLEQILREAEITSIDVVGIAESHCVKETAIDALKAGWPVRVFSDLTIPTSEELGIAAREEMDNAGVDQISSSEAFGFYDDSEEEAIAGWDDDFEDNLDDEDYEGEANLDDDENDAWDEWDEPEPGRELPEDWHTVHEEDFAAGDLDGNGVPDDLEDDEYGAADYLDHELPRYVEPGMESMDNRDHYGDDSDPELTSDGEREELDLLRNQVAVNEDLSKYDLDDFDINIEDVDFSADADPEDLDFSDIDFKPGRDL